MLLHVLQFSIILLRLIASLILIRHGESLRNEKILFTGCVYVPLTQKGVEEAIEAGKRTSNIPIDMNYTSSLIRAQTTAVLAITQHRRKKVSFSSNLFPLLIMLMISLVSIASVAIC